MKRVIYVAGLLCLIVGLSLITLSLSGILPNTKTQQDRWGDNINLVPMQPTEVLLFEEVLDEGDKVNLHLQAAIEYYQSALDSNLQIRKQYTLSVSIMDGEGVTYHSSDYDSETMLHSLGGYGDYPIDIYFQAPKYDSYRAIANYTGWHENRMGKDGDWYFKESSEPVWVHLAVDTEVTKPSSNGAFVAGGVASVALGAVLFAVPFAKKSLKS